MYLRRIVGACLLLAAVLTAAGCKRPAAKPPAMPPPDVTVERPLKRTVTDFKEYTGRFEAMELVEIRARVQGYLDKVNFVEGTEVSKGQLLYEIDPRTFQADVQKAEGEVSRLEAEVKRTLSEERRGKDLVARGAISPEDFTKLVTSREQAESSLKSARASLESAKLQLSFTKIYAPIDGRVSRTNVTEGNLVGFGEPTLLTTIVRMDPIYVYFEAPERDFLEYGKLAREEALPVAIERSIPIAVGLDIETGFPHPGVLDFRENRVDPGTGTITLRARLHNLPSLTGAALTRAAVIGAAPAVTTARLDRVFTPGLFARVKVPFGRPRERLMVPEVALAADLRGRYLLVAGPDNAVQYRPVTVGVTEEVEVEYEKEKEGPLREDGTKEKEWVREKVKFTVIEKGIGPDDRVIVLGIQKARPKAAVNPTEVPRRAALPGENPAPVGKQESNNGSQGPKAR